MEIDMKTLITLGTIAAGALGVTNIGTYRATAMPAQAEASHNLVMYQSQTEDLAACHKQLRECYKECARASSDHVSSTDTGPWDGADWADLETAE